MDLQSLLISLGINLTSSMIWDFIKMHASKGKAKDEIVKDLADYIQVDGADIKSEKIINFLISNGKLHIENSKIYSKEGLNYTTNVYNSELTIKKSGSKTNNTEISVQGPGASIKMIGNAKITQSEDRIVFSVGNNK